MTSHILIVAAGGALGATCRLLVVATIQRRFAEYNYPLGTLVVNVVGCFMIGLILRSVDSVSIQSQGFRLFMVTGFLGALTTFSAFGYETYELHQSQGFVESLSNVLLNVLLTLSAVMIGIQFGKWCFE